MTKENKYEKRDTELECEKGFLHVKREYKISPNKEAFIITGVYGIFGLLWIALSDQFLSIIVKDLDTYKQIQTYKGWTYVLLTIVLVFTLVQRRATLVRNAMIEINHAYDELQATYEELVATEEELKDQKNFNEHIFMDAHVMIGTWDREGRLTSLNPFGQKLFGYSEVEVVGKKWLDLLVLDKNKSKLVNNFEQIQNGHQIPNHESQFITKERKEIDLIWNNSLIIYQNKPSEILSIGTDITERKILEEKLMNVAYFDSLTGLPNRTLIEDEVKKLIELKEPFVFIHIDIDNFRQINETLGYSYGDLYIQYFAGQLSDIIKEPNKIARLSGDEFAILMIQPNLRIDIEKELNLLKKDLGRSWEVNHHEFFTSSCMGVAIYPNDGMDYNTLFQNADVAMHRAKKGGKGIHVFYSEEIAKDNIDNLKLANQLQYAIANKELVLYYQPQFNLCSGKITGVEALVRWIHPERGFIPPDRFIPLAEETGQIFELEMWIINTALHQKMVFEQTGREDITLSINLSSKALASEMNFFALEELFRSYDVDYAHITLEITETAIISDIGFAVERLKKLKKYGMRIALDDFGTGYSSLTHLKELPIDIVKLDRSFIKFIKEDRKNAMIIKAILYLTIDLDYEVVAEGIETEEQFKYLLKYKCQTGQGYLMSRPIPIEDLDEKLKCGFDVEALSKSFSNL